MWKLAMRERGDDGGWMQLLWGMRREEAEHYFDKFVGYVGSRELRLLAPDGSIARHSGGAGRQRQAHAAEHAASA